MGGLLGRLTEVDERRRRLTDHGQDLHELELVEEVALEPEDGLVGCPERRLLGLEGRERLVVGGPPARREKPRPGLVQISARRHWPLVQHLPPRQHIGEAGGP